MSLPPDKLFIYKKETESYEFMLYHKKDFDYFFHKLLIDLYY